MHPPRRSTPTLVFLAALAAATIGWGTACSRDAPSADTPAALSPSSGTSPVTAAPTTASPTTSTPPTTPPTTSPTTAVPPTTAAPEMPDVIGLRLQTAQDLIQTTGVFSSRSFDCTGAGRQQVLDRNWVVVTQSPAQGTPITEGDPLLGVVKLDEARSCV